MTELLFTWKYSNDATCPRGEVTVFKGQKLLNNAWDSAIVKNLDDFDIIKKCNIESHFDFIFNFQGDFDFLHFRADKEVQELLKTISE